jgi:hypothetical protein
MLRNNITLALTYSALSHICVPCVPIYKYINRNKALARYTSRYTGGTQWPQRLHSVPQEALS